MIRILIADDHAIVRQGLKQIVAEEPDMKVLGEAQNAREVLEHTQKGDCDVVVLDITMPGRSGIDLLKDLRREYPKLSVLVLTIHSEEQFAVRALKAGASGYLTKESAPEELLKAIRKVYTGGKYVSPSLAERLAFLLEEDTEQLLHERLSDREYQVFRMLASGKSLKEIATELSLSVKTVSTYRTRLLEKMNMTRNAELIHYAIQHGLIERCA